MNSMFAVISSRAPCHGDSITRRDVGVCRVKIDLPATTCGKDCDITPQRLNHTARFIEDIDAHAAVFHRVAEFSSGDEIHSHVVFHDLYTRVRGDPGHEGAFDFLPGGVAVMKDAAFRVSALPSQVEFMVSVAVLALVEMHPSWMSSAIRSGPSVMIFLTASSWQRLAASSVSRMWSSKESSSLITQATPPCAHAVFESDSALFVMSATRPFSAAFSAKESRQCRCRGR
jgi:hypothetical protein